MPRKTLCGFGVDAGLDHVFDECMPESVTVGAETLIVDVQALAFR